METLCFYDFRASRVSFLLFSPTCILICVCHRKSQFVNAIVTTFIFEDRKQERQTLEKISPIMVHFSSYHLDGASPCQSQEPGIHFSVGGRDTTSWPIVGCLTECTAASSLRAWHFAVGCVSRGMWCSNDYRILLQSLQQFFVPQATSVCICVYAY